MPIEQVCLLLEMICILVNALGVGRRAVKEVPTDGVDIHDMNKKIELLMEQMKEQ